jgi:squalene-hopene/tetraprenyl-beta-curcumene cyclase
LRAWAFWQPHLPAAEAALLVKPMAAARRYLAATQAPDGSWTPLWFGNQHRQDETNPTYGTATVMAALAAGDPLRHRAAGWLQAQQNKDGGWGGGQGTPSSIEETSLALSALVPSALAGTSAADRARIIRGAQWLIHRTQGGREFPPTPIGFYFAKLWYWENLYPVVWAVAALRAVEQWQQEK